MLRIVLAPNVHARPLKQFSIGREVIQRSMRKMALEMGMSEKSVRNIFHRLSLSFKMIQRQYLIDL
jgi:hypothetical protein